MKTNVLIGITILAMIVWVLQKTAFAFLSVDQTDFVGGMAVGLLIGSAVAWWATHAGTTTPS